MSTRKRRRDEAFSDDGIEPVLMIEDEANLNEAQKAKEQEVWDAIREVHYEAIEQLPLTLARQLSLMRKLDEQSISLTSRLFPTLQRYIKQRQAILGVSENQAEVLDETQLHVENTKSPVKTNGHSHTNGGLVVLTPRTRRNGVCRPSPRNSPPGSLPPELQVEPETTKEILTHIGWISEELLRASQEKVNLAQTNYDSVNRHIRLLDQAIEEQTASLSLEKSRLTTGIAVHLPEVIVPEGHPRKSRGAFVSDEELYTTNEDQASEMKTGRGSQRKAKKKGKETVSTGQSDQSKDSVPLIITLPATTQQDDIDVQPSEELYCYCNRVSFGEMIACDNNSCEREWFHLGCVGLTEIPEGEWFCEDCRDGKA